MSERAFRGGYVITPQGYTVPGQCDRWPKVSLLNADIHFHPDTPWVRSRSARSGFEIVLIGRPVSVEMASSDPARLAAGVADAFDRNDLPEALKMVAYFGGRYLAVLFSPSKTLVVPDCHATLSAYWARTPGSVVVGSHTALVAAAVGAGYDESVHAVMTSPEYSEPGGRYYPGVTTPFYGVRPIIANNMLAVSWDWTEASHERFYPFPDTGIGARPRDVAYEEFNERFSKHAGLVSRGGEHVGISLTAGLDSRTTLCAVAEQLAQQNGFASTFYKIGDASEDSVADLLVANRLADESRLRHRIVSITPSDDDSLEYASVYDETFPRGPRFRSLAIAYMRAMRNNDVSLISLMAETGTVFYRERDNPTPSAARLAEKFTTSAIRRDSRLIEIFEEYIDYSSFHSATMAGIDYHDLFYWEHRNSKWAALWFSECDLSHAVQLPFNDRRIVEVMLGIPEADRRSRYLQRRFVHDRGHRPE